MELPEHSLARGRWCVTQAARRTPRGLSFVWAANRRRTEDVVSDGTIASKGTPLR
jgi:hypothetical protein